MEASRPKHGKSLFFHFTLLFSLLFFHGIDASASAQEDEGREINLWPVLNVESGEAGSSVEFLAPVVEISNRGDSVVRAVRPLYIYKKSPQKTELDLPWPLVNFTRRGESASRRVFPFFWGFGPDRSYFNIFPIYFSQHNGGYKVVFLWPIVEFSADEGQKTQAVRPLFSRRINANGRSEINALWPLINFTQSPEHTSRRIFPVYWGARADGPSYFRIFPLVWHKAEADGRHRFFLFPIFWLQWNVQQIGRSGFVLPPVYSFRDYENRDHWNRGVFPIWADISDEDRRLIWAFPFAWETKGGQFDSFVLFPLYWNLKQGAVHALFPFYGRSRPDENDRSWEFVLFPLYLRRTHGDYVTRNLPWPIVGWGGDGIEDNHRHHWRFWPLGSARKTVYAEDGKSGRSTRNWALWPFFWFGSFHEKGSEKEGDRVISGNGDRGYFYFFPLAKWINNVASRRQESPFEGSVTETRALTDFDLFLLFDWEREEYLSKTVKEAEALSRTESQRKKFHFFPLYFYKDYASQTAPEGEKPEPLMDQEDAYRILFPLYWAGRERYLSAADGQEANALYVERRHRNVFPLYWSGAVRRQPVIVSESGVEIDPSGGRADERAHRWLIPLFTWNEKGAEQRATVLWPLYGMQETPGKRIDRSLLGLLFSRHAYVNGDELFTILWRAYRKEKRGETLKVDAFPFTSYRRWSDDDRRFRFLGGLFETGTDDNRRYLRLLYLPRFFVGGDGAGEPEEGIDPGSGSDLLASEPLQP